MLLVLVQNERTATETYEHWKDVTGAQYHFPNQYKNLIVEGTPFVYYRGARRADGTHGTPEYFGCGVVGSVWRDDEISESAPKNRWAWFCEIDDYLPFRRPVAAKQNDEYIEDIAQNRWGVGVRKLPKNTYDRILELGGLKNINLSVEPRSAIMPAIGEVEIPLVPEKRALLLPQTHTTKGEGRSGRSANRNSRYAKQIGDRAEKIVYQHLSNQLDRLGATELCWIAQEGETPGWDIQYLDAHGKLTAIEVKGTSATAFNSVELTRNEWDAARKLGERYYLFLVAECLSISPKFQMVKSPADLVDTGDLTITPLRWRLERGHNLSEEI